MDFNKLKETIQSIPEKLMNLFKKKDYKENDTKYNEIKKIDNELSKIYFEIMNSKEISLYKKELIIQKLGLLNLNLENLNVDLKQSDNVDEETLKKERKKDRIIMAIIMILILTLPLMGFVAMTAYSIYSMIHLTKIFLAINSDADKNKGVEERLRSMMNTLHNCSVFLVKKHNIWIENQNKSTENDLMESLKVNIANELLQEYFNSGYYRKVPENIESYLIKMLQEDLQTEEDEIEKLMAIAKNKISYESLNEELNLGLNLIKKDKK